MLGHLEGSRPPRRVRVVLADDNRLFREMLTAVLGADERIEIVGQAGDGAEAVSLALALRPDVVLMDVYMPRMDGIEATRRIRSELRSTRVLILSASPLPEDRRRAREVGAAAYLTKGSAATALVDELLGAPAREPTLPPLRMALRPLLPVTAHWRSR